MKTLEEIDAAGGFERARAAAREYTARAERALALLSRKRQRAVLTELTQRLLHRQYALSLAVSDTLRRTRGRDDC